MKLRRFITRMKLMWYLSCSKLLMGNRLLQPSSRSSPSMFFALTREVPNSRCSSEIQPCSYKSESSKSSKFAAAVLKQAGIDVVIKSDHPGVDSRFLNRQAGQAHNFGLSLEGAMNSITTTPARRMGLDHRIGCKCFNEHILYTKLILSGDSPQIRL